MESIKKLAIFLKLFNVYDAYILNTKKSIYNTTDKTLYISGAFTWSSTEQGNDFWFKLDRKWKLFLENKTILQEDDTIELFDIKYQISKGALGYYLYNNNGLNSKIFDKLGLNVDNYDVGLGGIFPYRKTIDELQELIIELAEKAIDKTGIDTKFLAIFRNDYEYSKETEQPEKEKHNQESTEKDCLITEPIITIKKHKKQTFVL